MSGITEKLRRTQKDARQNTRKLYQTGTNHYRTCLISAQHLYLLTSQTLLLTPADLAKLVICTAIHLDFEFENGPKLI